MRIIYKRMIVLALIICAGRLLMAGQESEDGVESLGNEVSLDSAAAVALAMEYTGFSSKSDSRLQQAEDINSSIITAVDSTTPFLHQAISDSRLWLIELKNMAIASKANERIDPSYQNLRDFRVLVDSRTGNLIEISSKLEHNDKNVLPPPSAHVAEVQLLAAGEKYTGFPTIRPRTTFVEALKACKFYPTLAKEIVAYYVLHEYQGAEPKPVWIIHLKGLPPFPDSRLGTSPEYMRNHRRWVIDAETGKAMFSNNRPQRTSPVGKD